MEPEGRRSRRRHTRCLSDWSSDVCSSDLSVCEFQSPDPDVVKKNIETCKQFVGLVAEIGGKGVKVRPNGISPGADLDKTLEQIGKALVPCEIGRASCRERGWSPRGGVAEDGIRDA